MPEGSGTRALAAQFVFIAQSDVDHAPLSAVQRIEPERGARVLHFFGSGQRADAQFFDAQRPIVVRVERDARVIVGVQAQHLLRHQFQREQKLGPIGQQQIHVGTLELDDDVGVFEIRMAVVSGFDGKVQIELPIGDHLTQKLLDPGTSFINRILGIQALFLPSFTIAFFAAATASTGAAVLLKNHCWASPTTLPVSQYNTSPLDAYQKKKRYISGINCIIFCWLGSPPVGAGVIFCSAITGRRP